MQGKQSGLACAILSLAGLGLCAYLVMVHIALLRGELFGGGACSSVGTMFNCHAVTASPLGSLFGIPLATWGLIGYLATFSLGVIAWEFAEWTSKALIGLVSISLLFVVIDAGLLAAMLMRIHYLCPVCLLSYVVNLSLLLVSQRALGQSGGGFIRELPATLGAFLPRREAAVAWIFWGIVVTGGLGAVAVSVVARYAVQGSQGNLRQQMTQFVTQQKRVSVDVSGDPSMGTPSQTFQIVEFSDFLCPSCQRASKFNPILLASHQHEALFVFKSFPLDQTCNSTVTRTVHPSACRIAAATECAQEQGKFWALHDLIFEEGPQYKAVNLERDAQRAGLNLDQFRGCLESGRGLEAVKRDVAEGARIGVNSTPTYVINGLPVTGSLTPAVFEEILRALRHQTQEH